MSINVSFDTQKVISNLKKIVNINADLIHRKICITYYTENECFIKTDYLILKRGNINYNEMISFLGHCLPAYDIYNITFRQLNGLHEALFDLLLPA